MTVIEEGVEAQAAILSEVVPHMSGDQQQRNEPSALGQPTLEGTVARKLDNKPAHQEHVAPAGFVGGEWMDLVHTLVNMQDSMQFPQPRRQWTSNGRIVAERYLGCANSPRNKTAPSKKRVLKVTQFTLERRCRDAPSNIANYMRHSVPTKGVMC